MGESWDKVVILRHDVRDKLRYTEYMSCYAASVARMVRRRHFIAKIVVAGAACVPFMVKLQEASDEVATWAAAVVPLVAITLPIWNPDKIVEIASKLHGQYSVLVPQLRRISRRIRVPDLPPDEETEEWKEEVAAIQDELFEIEERASSFSVDVGRLPDVERLKKTCLESIPSYDDENGGMAPKMGPGVVLYGPPPPVPIICGEARVTSVGFRFYGPGPAGMPLGEACLRLSLLKTRSAVIKCVAMANPSVMGWCSVPAKLNGDEKAEFELESP